MKFGFTAVITTDSTTMKAIRKPDWLKRISRTRVLLRRSAAWSLPMLLHSCGQLEDRLLGGAGALAN